ncbi:MAG: terminase family protein, partial [Thermosynechococcaceae cyanobacterium]
MLDSLKYVENLERRLEKYLPPEQPRLRAKPLPPVPWPKFAPRTRIRSGKQMIRFIPYRYQSLIIDLFNRHRGILVVKTRQLGVTECFANRFLQRAYENPAYAAVVFSRHQEDSSNVQRRFSLMAGSANIPLPINGATRCQLTNGAQAFFRPSTDDAGRSLESIHDALFDEAGFVANMAKLYGAASPSQNVLGEDARTAVVSTPNGLGGFFWQLLCDNNPPNMDVLAICEGVREGKLFSNDLPGFYWFCDRSGWVKVFLHWLA